MECKGRPHACVHAATFSLAKLHHCAHSRKCCVQKRRFYPYIFLYVLRATCITCCVQICAQRTKYCVFSHCVQSLRMACIYGCMFTQLCTRPRRLTKIYILSATGYLLQPCCQLEMQLTLSLCLLSGTCYTIDYCHPLSSQITQNSLFISHYYMLTSPLSVLCPPSPI